jgi:hypothetical protein
MAELRKTARRERNSADWWYMGETRPFPEKALAQALTSENAGGKLAGHRCIAYL